MPAPICYLTHHGSPAIDALRRAIDDAHGGDPLAPVTVLVPSNTAGLSARRALGRSGGLVNVRFMVAARLAELIASGHTGKHGPLGPSLRAEAIRVALTESPGVFESVAGHGSAVASLDRTLADLRPLDEEALDRVAAASRRGASVVDIYRRFRERTRDYYDTTDLYESAARVVESTGVPGDIGAVIAFLPREFEAGQWPLFHAIAAHGHAALVIGHHGDSLGDTVAHDLLDHAGAAGASPPAASPPERGTRVVTAADPDEEVRTIIRRIAGELEKPADDAVPLHRIAVLYTSDEPYAATFAERFAAAGIPFNGPAASRLADATPGRLLLLLLEIARRDFRREDVIELFSLPLAAPGGGPYPAARWEILARAAMPGPGIETWRTRLGYLAGVRREDAAARRDEDEDGQARRLESDADYLASLLDAVEALHERLRDLHACDSWAAFAEWCRSALDDFLGGRSHSEDDAAALDDVRSVLDDLASLDVVGATPGVDVFSRALRSQLEGPWGRHGVFEEGVFVGPLAAARGLNFDLVFVAGMVEGLAPRAAREDPLLPDRERRDVPGLEAAVSARASRERDAFLAGTAIATRRVFSVPLADMRAGREQLPARWLLEICARLQDGDAATIPVAARTFRNWAFGVEVRPPWLDVIPSQAAGVRHPPAEMAPADPGEFDLAALGATDDAAGHPLARTLGISRGIHASRARMSRDFTEWDGFVGSDPGLALSSGQVTSPTGLEHWATCGFRYFLQRVLHVTPVEEPDDGLRIDARDRGSLVHRAIEQFLRPYINAGDVPLPWSESHRAELRAIGEALCDQLEAGGMTGKPLLWRLARRRILAGLDRVVDIDNERFDDRGYSPLATELTFGRGDDPLEIPLADGTARFRGKIDRVDRAADGTLAVIDYKTGKPDPFKDFGTNVLDNGRRLQLPVYARAAARHFDAPVGQLAYVFASPDADNPVAGAVFNDDADRALREGLQRTDDVLREGVFPAWPGNFNWDSFEHCRWCDFARLCVRDRGRAWNRKMEDEKLEGYAAAVGVVSEVVDQDAVDPEPSDG